MGRRHRAAAAAAAMAMLGIPASAPADLTVATAGDRGLTVTGTGAREAYRVVLQGELAHVLPRDGTAVGTTTPVPPDPAAPGCEVDSAGQMRCRARAGMDFAELDVRGNGGGDEIVTEQVKARSFDYDVRTGGGDGASAIVQIGAAKRRVSRRFTIDILIIGGDAGETLGIADQHTYTTPTQGIRRVLGGGGDDSIYGSRLPDVLVGGEGADVILGGAGGDVIGGNDGDDRLSGEKGNDRVHGQRGNDGLWGHDGDDTLVGGSGDDTLKGGDHLDRLYGNAGGDSFNGGPHRDLLRADDGERDRIVNCGSGAGDRLIRDSIDPLAKTCEDVETAD